MLLFPEMLIIFTGWLQTVLVLRLLHGHLDMLQPELLGAFYLPLHLYKLTRKDNLSFDSCKSRAVLAEGGW